MSRALGRVGIVLGVSTGSLVGLLGLAPAASNPASASWSDLDAWYRSVGPGAATVGAVRVGALVVALWLLVACALQLVAAVPVGRVLQPLADRVAPAALRGLAGASLTAGLLVASPLIGGGSDAPGTATMHPMPDEVPATDTTTTTTAMTVPSTSVPGPAVSATPAVPVVPAVPDAGSEDYVVSRSESFWSIAADRIEEVLHRPPTEPEVRVYWGRLIEANRERLVDPGNADLLYAGQTLALPPTG